MERWEIRAAPTPKDPGRHLLLLRGGPSDVAALLKKFGALMGRPAPCASEGFNLSLPLHRLKASSRTRLEDWLNQACPPAPPEPAPEVASQASSEQEPPPALVPVQPPAPVTIPEEPVSSEPAVVAAESFAPPPEEPGSLSLAVPMRREWTFETLLVGAYNRFAHAAAMSVVSSPGSMYNPLFLYGVPGTGKSHLLAAIGTALAKGLGDAVVLHTSGPRLAYAVNAAEASGTMASVEKRAGDAKALLVDDIHFMDVAGANKDVLAGLFKNFFDRRLQVVITSLYPPRSLGILEEALRFSFSKGWSVDLKLPSPVVQKELLTVVSEGMGAGFSPEELAVLHEKLSAWGYQDLNLWLRRLILLKTMKATASRPIMMAELLALIYEPLLATVSEEPNITGAAGPPPADPGGTGEPLVVLSPRGASGAGPFAASAFREVGVVHGLTRSYRHAFWETYDEEQSSGVPFIIGDLCRRAGVTSAIVVGPSPGSPLASRSAELSHAVRRILEGLGVRLGWIPYEALRLPAHYINAHLDLSPDPPRP